MWTISLTSGDSLVVLSSPNVLLEREYPKLTQ